MKILITENKLQLLFNGMVSDYDKLIKSERDYDFYDESKSRYIDYTPFNFYMDDEDWENDEWIMQYAEKPPYNKPVEGFETPLLIYSEWYFKSLTTFKAFLIFLYGFILTKCKYTFSVVFFTIVCQCYTVYGIIVHSTWCRILYSRTCVLILKVF